MNTRIQVEHTITEVVPGVDIVRAQVQIARRRAPRVRPGRDSAAGPRDRVPHQRRGRRQRLSAVAGDDHVVPRAGRPGRARRLRRHRGLGDLAALRPDDREADRPRRRPRRRDRAHAARARRVRDRRREDADRLPQGAALPPVLPRGRDLSRHRRVASCSPRARRSSSSRARAGAARGHRRARSSASTFAEVDGRRVEVKVLVPEPPYRELARRRRERAAAGAGGGASDSVASPMQGTVLAGRGRRRRRGRGRPGDLHRRGDEDGERGDRAPARASSRTSRSRRGSR